MLHFLPRDSLINVFQPQLEEFWPTVSGLCWMYFAFWAPNRIQTIPFSLPRALSTLGALLRTPGVNYSGDLVGGRHTLNRVQHYAAVWERLLSAASPDRKGLLFGLGRTTAAAGALLARRTSAKLAKSQELYSEVMIWALLPPANPQLLLWSTRALQVQYVRQMGLKHHAAVSCHVKILSC